MKSVILPLSVHAPTSEVEQFGVVHENRHCKVALQSAIYQEEINFFNLQDPHQIELKILFKV